VSILRANFDRLTSKAVPVAPEPQDADSMATFRFGTRVTGVYHVNGKVEKVYDVTSTKATFFDEKLFLVGEAQFNLRPNVGMSTTHAAYDCNELE
jgi:hypothetical protein